MTDFHALGMGSLVNYPPVKNALFLGKEETNNELICHDGVWQLRLERRRGNVQGDTSGLRLGWVDFDLGCSSIHVLLPVQPGFHLPKHNLAHSATTEISSIQSN